MKGTAFDLFHPVVAFVYFAAFLVLGMAAMQPVYLAVTLLAAFAYGAAVRGLRATLQSLKWQVPLVLVIALANPLFSASGSTELFRIGTRAFYLESLAFGACMGAVLMCALLVFANASRVLTSDKVMALFGNAVPTVGLMLSMIARLVPQFVRRGQDIANVQRACTAAGAPRGDSSAARTNAFGSSSRGLAKRMRAAQGGLRTVSVLMGWGMEDSLETADAMRARGWGAAGRRTTYARYRFRGVDAAALTCVAVLALASAAAAWVACAQFRFYPSIEGWAAWYSYAPYVLFAALPLIMEARERVRWSR